MRCTARSAMFYEVKSVAVVAEDWWHEAQVREPSFHFESLSGPPIQTDGKLPELQIHCTWQNIPASANSPFYPVRSSLKVSCSHQIPWPLQAWHWQVVQIGGVPTLSQAQSRHKSCATTLHLGQGFSHHDVRTLWSRIQVRHGVRLVTFSCGAVDRPWRYSNDVPGDACPLS